VEVPALNAFNQRSDSVVIGISLDYGSIASVRDAIAKHNLDFHAHVAGGKRRDPKSAFRQIGPVDFFPTSYLYDPHGELAMYIPGQFKQDKVLAQMKAWRGGQAVAGAESTAPTFAVDLKRLETVLNSVHGAAGRKAFADWHAMLREAAGRDETGRLERVNGFFNRRILPVWQETLRRARAEGFQ